MNHLLFPLIEEDEHHYGISIADTQGRSYHISDADGLIKTTVTSLKRNGRESVTKTWQDGEALSRVTVSTNYDARNRPWFYPALGSDAVCWTEPYVFFSEKIVGLHRVHCRSSGITCRRTTSVRPIPMQDLYSRIHRMQPSPNSQILILRQDAALYAPDLQQGTVFTSLQESTTPSLNKPTPLGARTKRTTASPIRHAGKTWWCASALWRRAAWVSFRKKGPCKAPASGARMLLVLAGASVALAALSSLLRARYSSPPARRK